MILRRIELQHIGPFADTTALELEPDVIVLTGANDTGKTSVLNILDRLFTGQAIEESDANIFRVDRSEKTWETDEQIRCTLTFDGTSDLPEYVTGLDLSDATSLVATVQMAPSAYRWQFAIQKRDGTLHHLAGTWSKRPGIVLLPMEQQIGPVINLANPSVVERQLLNVAFDKTFDIKALNSLTPPLYSRQITQAAGRLNALVTRLLSPLRRSKLHGPGPLPPDRRDPPRNPRRHGGAGEAWRASLEATVVRMSGEHRMAARRRSIWQTCCLINPFVSAARKPRPSDRP